jgi:Zn-finger protein
LYFMGDKCGGIFAINEKGVKDCAACHLPHTRSYYDVIIGKLKE